MSRQTQNKIEVNSVATKKFFCHEKNSEECCDVENYVAT